MFLFFCGIIPKPMCAPRSCRCLLAHPGARTPLPLCAAIARVMCSGKTRGPAASGLFPQRIMRIPTSPWYFCIHWLFSSTSVTYFAHSLSVVCFFTLERIIFSLCCDFLQSDTWNLGLVSLPGARGRIPSFGDTFPLAKVGLQLQEPKPTGSARTSFAGGEMWFCLVLGCCYLYVIWSNWCNLSLAVSDEIQSKITPFSTSESDTSEEINI